MNQMTYEAWQEQEQEQENATDFYLAWRTITAIFMCAASKPETFDAVLAQARRSYENWTEEERARVAAGIMQGIASDVIFKPEWLADVRAGMMGQRDRQDGLPDL